MIVITNSVSNPVERLKAGDVIEYSFGGGTRPNRRLKITRVSMKLSFGGFPVITGEFTNLDKDTIVSDQVIWTTGRRIVSHNDYYYE